MPRKKKPGPARSPGAPAAAERRWYALPDEERLELAADAARRLARRFQRRFDNVISVGAGYRTDTDLGLTRGICIRFLVRGKPVTERARKRFPESRRLPSSVVVTRTIRGRRVEYAIPTDVAEAPTHADGGMNMRAGLLAVAPGATAGVTGAMGALVCRQGDPGRLFVLGCHHVLTRSLTAGGCAPREPTDLHRNEPARQRIGRLFDWAALRPAKGYGLDAALAIVEDPGAVSSFIHDMQPARVAPPHELPRDYRIYAPRQPLKAEFVSMQFYARLRYQCGAVVTVEKTYESIALTRAGDSGSPLIGFDGTLFGMHFYGIDADSCLAIPASMLFEPGRFIVPIALRLDHDP